MNTDKDLAARLIRGVVAGMVTAVAAATVVGFWLSYGGLHDFATRAGMTGPEAWAWPASVDLFIIAGEAGVTISALRRRRDPLAWAYLAAGFAASVTGNALHVHAGQLPWAPYAVAVVPPVAAMLALGALLRHVYRLAIDAHLAGLPKAARHPRESWWQKAQGWLHRRPATEGTLEPSAALAEPPVEASREVPSGRSQKATRKAPARPSDAERATQIRALLEGGQKVTIDDAMDILSAGRPVAKRILALASNGHGPQD